MPFEVAFTNSQKLERQQREHETENARQQSLRDDLMKVLQTQRSTHLDAIAELKEDAKLKESKAAIAMTKVKEEAAAHVSAELHKGKVAQQKAVAAAREHSDKLKVALEEQKAAWDAERAGCSSRSMTRDPDSD